MDAAYEDLNEQWKESWGDHYIDMIAYAKTADGRIRVFSPEGKLISQDCEHLTRGGAVYYAERIDFTKIFEK